MRIQLERFSFGQIGEINNSNIPLFPLFNMAYNECELQVRNRLPKLLNAISSTSNL
jgi:hypothetical protein